MADFDLTHVVQVALPSFDTASVFVSNMYQWLSWSPEIKVGTKSPNHQSDLLYLRLHVGPDLRLTQVPVQLLKIIPLKPVLAPGCFYASQSS